MSNILIVESKNDQIFFETLVNHLNTEVQELIFIDEYKELEGLNQKKLTNSLKELKAEIAKKGIEKVGIIIDIDLYSKEERLQFINQSIQASFGNFSLLNTGEFIDIFVEEDVVKFACYFTNVDQKGELETLLKIIKTKDSTYADCLESWRQCLENKGKQISQKDFDKFWLNNYIRYDTCSKTERKQAGKYCSMINFNYIMENKKDIWNFDHLILDEVKMFLNLFK